MTAEINTHFILVKWVCNTTVEGTISGLNIVSIGDYYSWKSSVENLNEDIMIPISNMNDHVYNSGKAFLNDISCKVLNKLEKESLIEMIGEEFGVSRFMNYRTMVNTTPQVKMRKVSESETKPKDICYPQ